MRKLTIYIVKHRPSTRHSAESRPCHHCTKEIKRLGIKKIVYVDAFGEINKKLTRDYHTDYICPGYKEYARLNLKVD
jgi:deoxycytidylate deaminase